MSLFFLSDSILASVSVLNMLDNLGFSYRSGLSTDNKKVSYAEMMTDDEQISRDERCFRLWINSLGISSYVNNIFEDARNGYFYFYFLRLLLLC